MTSRIPKTSQKRKGKAVRAKKHTTASPSSPAGAASGAADEGAAPTTAAAPPAPAGPTWYEEAVNKGREIQAFPTDAFNIDHAEDAARKEKGTDDAIFRNNLIFRNNPSGNASCLLSKVC